MTIPGKRLIIYIGESDSWRGRSLHMSILEMLRKNGVAGATVMRGLAGFGAHSRIRSEAVERLSVDLPVVITVVDTPERIEQTLALVQPMVREGLITLEDIDIIKYSHRDLQPLPSDLPISEVMTRSVTAVTPDTPARRVIELLLGQMFRALPVVDEHKQVVGIITEDDLLRKAGMPVRLAVGQRLEAADLEVLFAQVRQDQTAAEIMTSPVYTAQTDEALGHVVQKLLDHQLKRMPVIDAHQQLVGMVSRLDILRTMTDQKNGKPEQTAEAPSGRTLGEVMTVQIPTVNTTDDLVDVVEKMLRASMTYVIVLDDARHPVGIITEGDLVARVAPGIRPNILRALAARVLGKDVGRGNATAREIMSKTVLSASQETGVLDAINMMMREGRKRVVVVDDQGYLLGLVDRQTLLAASLGL
ncbi:MAG TPA: DUF190 domain-containing protein [Aggregatilineaceae bacterium]|nr:DUF190 domain-containing protein [Aggregatilineaceae bacterium]